MIGQPDYQAYVDHAAATHPDQPPLDKTAFFRLHEQRRFGGSLADLDAAAPETALALRGRLAAGQDAERRHQARQTGGSDAHRLEFDLAQAPALTRRAG